MIDSQAQVRWLAAFLVLIVLFVGPMAAGWAASDTTITTTEFDIHDLRASPPWVIAIEKAKADPQSMVLVPPGKAGECRTEARKACPSLDSDPVLVPMSVDADIAETLEGVYRNMAVRDLADAEATELEAVVTRTDETFGWYAAVVTGALLLTGSLLAVVYLAGRQFRRPVSDTPGARPPVPPTPRPTETWDAGPAPRRSTPPVLSLTHPPGMAEVLRAHGAGAKARSHVAGTGGYVAVGDVLVWAVPTETVPPGGFAAFPDDDVRVTFGARSPSVAPTLDGGSRP